MEHDKECKDRVKARVQLTRLGKEIAECSFQVDRNAVVVLAPPQPLTFVFDSAHEEVSKVHFNQPFELFEKWQDEVQQLMVGVNSCLLFLGHETFVKAPHSIIDGFMSKLFTSIFAAANRQAVTHQVTLKAQFVSCHRPSPGSLSHYTDLLSTSSDPTHAAYTSVSTYDASFSSSAITLDRPEDGVNCYVMGLHNLHAYTQPPALLETSSIFVLDVIQTPRTPDDVPFASKLHIVTLPCYTNAGTGDALSRFTMLVDDVAHTHEGGRAVVNTQSPMSNDPLHEVLIGEGLLGGNCTTTLMLFLEEQAAADMSTIYKLLDRCSSLRNIVSTPLINDVQTLLYTTRMKNAFNLLRQIATENGRAVPLNEFDKFTIRHEAHVERLKNQLLLFQERCEKLQTELVDSERERLHLAKSFERLKEAGDVQQSAQQQTHHELMERLNLFERDLYKTKIEAEVRREQEEKNKAAESEKQDIEREYITLHANYDHLKALNGDLTAAKAEVDGKVAQLATHNTELALKNSDIAARNTDLTLQNSELAVLKEKAEAQLAETQREIKELKEQLESSMKDLAAQKEQMNKQQTEEVRKIHALEVALMDSRERESREPVKDDKAILALQAKHIQELRSLIKSDTNAYDVFSAAVDDLLEMVEGTDTPNKHVLERQARHSRQLLQLETELMKAKDSQESAEDVAELHEEVRNLKRTVSLRDKEVQSLNQSMLAMKARHVAELRDTLAYDDVHDVQRVVRAAFADLLTMIHSSDEDRVAMLEKQTLHTRQLLELETKLHAAQASKDELVLPDDPQCSFKDFLSGPYQTLVREREELKARALRAEAEREFLEQSMATKMELYHREKAQLQMDLAHARGR